MVPFPDSNFCAELLLRGHAKGQVELALGAIVHPGKDHLFPILEVYGMLP